MKQKAARNKTIDFTLEEGHVYLERCILAENGDQLKTVLQDGSTMTPDALYDQYISGNERIAAKFCGSADRGSAL